jgi:hypothetical protein
MRFVRLESGWLHVILTYLTFASLVTCMSQQLALLFLTMIFAMIPSKLSIKNRAQFDGTICEVLCSATAGSKMEDESEGGMMKVEFIGVLLGWWWWW